MERARQPRRQGIKPPFFTKKWRISRSEAKAIRQPRDRLKWQPQERQHSAAVFGGTRDRLPPARGAVSCVMGSKPVRAETASWRVRFTRARPRRGTPVFAFHENAGNVMVFASRGRLLQMDISDVGPPSKTLMSFAEEMASHSDLPILDAGCGYGRNAVALASRGSSVVCVDQKLERLHALVRLAPNRMVDLGVASCKAGQLYPLVANLDPHQWPFGEKCFGGIICVHFLKISLFEAFRSSLAAEGYLYIETFGGQGRNYLDLPKAGQLHDLLSTNFHVLFYREKKVGPGGSDAVTVKLFARKRTLLRCL